MVCQHNIYNGKSTEIDCICPVLEDGKNHMIFKEGFLTKKKFCPLTFGKIKTIVKDDNLIIKRKELNENSGCLLRE